MTGNFYFKLFETFKDFGFSKYVGEMRGLILQALTGQEFTLDLLPEDYIPTGLTQGKYFCPELKDYLLPVNKEGIPYRNFADDPDAIIQIKNMLNALYHTQMALQEMEGLDTSLKHPLKDAQTLWSSVIEHSYQASYLFTHLDPEVLAAFAPEMNVIQSLLTLLQTKSDNLSKKGEKLTKEIEEKAQQTKELFIAYQTGRITGIAIDQLGNNRQQIDFTFVTNVFTQAPEYIDKLTQLIKKYSGKLAEAEPNIDERTILMLQEDTIKIIHGLDDLYNGNRLLMPLKVVRYIHLLRHIVSVTNNIVDQVNYASESSQEAIAKQMRYLKYDLIQELFTLTDKIEDYGMFAPGLFSKPLMENIEKMYGELSYYVGKVVDFSEHGEDLQQLNDTVLQRKRVEVINQRLMKQKAQLVLWSHKSDAFDRFYAILDKYPNTEISELPEEVRMQLTEEYRVVQAVMRKHDIKMHDRMVAALSSEQKATTQGWINWFKDTTCWLVGKGHENTNWLQTLKPDLERILKSEQASILFRIRVESSLRYSIGKKSVRLVPYRKEFSICSVDERKLAELPENTKVTKSHNSELIDAHLINAEKAYFLQAVYIEKRSDINRALEAYQEFQRLCKKLHGKPLHTLSAEQKKQMLSWYKEFQPWLYVQSDSMRITDQRVIASLLSPDDTSVETPVSSQSFLDYSNEFQRCLKQYDAFYQQRIEHWSKYADDMILLEQKSTKILPTTGYELSLMSITSFDKLDISKLEKKPYLIKDAQDKYQIWGYKKHKWQLTDIGNLTIDFEWEEAQSVFISPEDEIFKALKKGHVIATSGYLLPQGYAKKIAEYRQSLLNWRQFLTPAMQAQLEITETKDKSVVPYPEMEDPHRAHAQPQQVAAIKRLYNGLYHLEGIVSQLEKLHNDSSKSVYVYHLLMSYNHIIEMYKLSRGLYEDPHSRLLARQFMSTIYNIYEKLQPEIKAYQVGSEEITEIETPVQYTAFWYAMNAFMLLPDHIRAKKAGQTIDPKLQHKQQLKAKGHVTDIERIINSSDSYFQLFLESPTMVRLFLQLRSSLNDFTETVHEASIENLKNIDVHLFYEMLREADQWERRVGLKPGLLSDPLEKILDKFYQGMIEALGLVSEQEFELLFNNERIAKRKAVIIQEVLNATMEHSKISEYEEDMQLLHQYVNDYIKLYSVPLPPELLMASIFKEKIEVLYRKYASKFSQEMKLLEFKKAMIELSTHVDTYTKSIVKEAELKKLARQYLVHGEDTQDIERLLDKFTDDENDREVFEDVLKRYAANPKNQKDLLAMLRTKAKSTEEKVEFRRLVQKYTEQVVKQSKLDILLEKLTLGEDNHVVLAILANQCLANSGEDEIIDRLLNKLVPEVERRIKLESLLEEYAQDSTKKLAIHQFLNRDKMSIAGQKDLKQLRKMYLARIQRRTKFEALQEQYVKNNDRMAKSETQIVSLLNTHYKTLTVHIARLKRQKSSLSLMNTAWDKDVQAALNRVLAAAGLKGEAFDETGKQLSMAAALRYLSIQYEAEVPLFEVDDEKQKVFNEHFSTMISGDGTSAPVSEPVALLKYLEAIFKQKASTLKLKKEIAQLQYEHCVNIEQKQMAEKAEHRKQYIAKHFDKVVQQLQKGFIGFSDTVQNDYNDNLSEFLNAKKKSICKKVENKKDIRKALELELGQLNVIFAKKNYKKYAHLQAIMMSLNDIETYCLGALDSLKSSELVFEDHHTLSAKLIVVNKLKEIGRNKDKPADERISELQQAIKSYAQSSVLLEQKTHKNYTWQWFKQFCYLLLAVVGLYTPVMQKNYQKLLDASEKNTDKISFPPRHVFFSAKEAVQRKEDKNTPVPLVQPGPVR